MNSSELKRQIELSEFEPYFFKRSTMSFFGDTMRNYGVYKTKIDTNYNQDLECYALYRKNPVKHNLQTTSYFNAKTFKREFIK